jgi:predicted dehydrogenase
MIDSLQAPKFLVAALTACVLAACGKAEPPTAAPPAAATTIKLTAGIQDIMTHMIDPAADFLWESVSSTVTAEGVEEKQPRTDDEWNEVRRHAIILTESANLILMEGRHVAREGMQLEDHGTPGNLTAEESEQAIAADRATFVAFSQALHDVGAAMLKAADDRNPQGILDAGETMDQVCEGCHLKFWYPGQKIPAFPDQAPEPK